MSARMLALLAGLALAPGCGLLGTPSMGPDQPPPAWELPPPPAREAPVVQAGALTRLELDNGLKLLILEDHRLPKVAVGVAVRRGAAIVDRDRAGLASYTAELMRRGAGERDALALARSVDEIGATLSVSADWDSINAGTSGLSRDLDRLVEVLADVVLRPRFDPGEGRKARDEKLAALEQAKDDPGTIVHWRATGVLYPEHRYGLPLEGTPESVRGLDAAQARAFHRRVFVPGNAVLFAVGDVSAEDFAERARQAFGPDQWESGEVPAPAPAPPARSPESTRIAVLDRPDLVQAQIVVLHEGIGRSDPERIAADLMNKVLGGSGFASRLMQRLRADEGLTYGVWSGYSLRRHPGPFRVATFTRVPETGRVVELLLGEMRAIRENPPGQEELAKAASLAVGRFGLSLETSAAVMGSLVDLDVYALPEDSLDTYRGRVRAVDTEAVARVASERVHPDRVAIVVLGPAELLSPQLERLGPVQILQP
jgi:zinc protease